MPYIYMYEYTYISLQVCITNTAGLSATFFILLSMAHFVQAAEKTNSDWTQQESDYQKQALNKLQTMYMIYYYTIYMIYVYTNMPFLRNMLKSAQKLNGVLIDNNGH